MEDSDQKGYSVTVESAKYDKAFFYLYLQFLGVFSWIRILIFRSGSGLRKKKSDQDPDKKDQDPKKNQSPSGQKTKIIPNMLIN